MSSGRIATDQALEIEDIRNLWATMTQGMTAGMDRYTDGFAAGGRPQVRGRRLSGDPPPRCRGRRTGSIGRSRSCGPTTSPDARAGDLSHEGQEQHHAGAAQVEADQEAPPRKAVGQGAGDGGDADIPHHLERQRRAQHQPASAAAMSRRITQDEYDRKARELKERQAEIATRIDQHQDGEGNFRTIGRMFGLAEMGEIEVQLANEADADRQIQQQQRRSDDLSSLLNRHRADSGRLANLA